MVKLNSKHPFYSANDFFREKFNTKIIKLAIDGGFTCPNRDGTLSYDGCIFCSNKGSGDFAGNRCKSIEEQYYEMTDKMKDKWKSGKYMMYFQAFTNTYSNISNLRKLYYTAINMPDVVALSIATRPDCINDEILDLFEEINEKVFLQVELGLQTSNEKTVRLINRCYENTIYDNTVSKLNKRNINNVTHIILGLPYENFDDMKSSVDYAIKCGTNGLKLQLLHILKSTRLYEMYKNNHFNILTFDEYIQIVVDIIEYIPDDIVIHRLTGDANKSDLFEPWWSLNKRRVLNGISKEFIKRNSYQGMLVK